MYRRVLYQVLRVYLKTSRIKTERTYAQVNIAVLINFSLISRVAPKASFIVRISESKITGCCDNKEIFNDKFH